MLDTGKKTLYQLRNDVRLLRPKQWIKNFFVLAPLIFAKGLFQVGPVFTALLAFVGFSLAASVVYILNDINDVEADRAHPEKKHRAIASGAVSIPHAYGVAVILTAFVALILPHMSLRYGIAVIIYVLINVAYTLKLKEVILLDVFVVATGFMLRVLAGAYAIDVQVSSWIVLCTLFISLLLGFAKRRGELVEKREAGPSSVRKVLLLYKVEFIDQMLTITAAGAVISYALYTVAPRTLEVYGTDKMIYTTVFVLYGVFRYIYLTHTSSATENPTNAVTSDRAILVTGVLWIVACIGLIYFKGTFLH